MLLFRIVAICLAAAWCNNPSCRVLAADVSASYFVYGAPNAFSGAQLGSVILPAYDEDAIVAVLNVSTLAVDACAAGFFSYADSQACTACEAGKYSATATANASDTCVPCEAGKYSPTIAANSSSYCIPCPANTYFNGTGGQSVAVCAACPANTSSYAGSKLLQACVCNGGFSGPNGGTCSPCNASVWCLNGQANPCPTNSKSAPLSSSLAQCLCLPGFFGDTTMGGPELTLCQVLTLHVARRGVNNRKVLMVHTPSMSERATCC